MLGRRVMPTLLVDSAGHLVKTKLFNQRIYIGDPLNAAYIFSDYLADEIIVLDIDATNTRKCIPIDFVKSLAIFTNCPLAIGGGISKLEQIESILAVGVERVILGAALSKDIRFISEASKEFGSSSVSVIISCVRVADGKPMGYFGTNFSRVAPMPLQSLALICEAYGAGEIIIYDVDRDGMREGFDFNLLSSLSEKLSIPLVAAGGYGTQDHLADLFERTQISGVAVGSAFVFAPDTEQVLLSYPIASRGGRKF